MPDLLRIPDSDVLYRCWESQNPGAILLLVHRLGAHAGRWRYLGDYFQAHQITAYALELKGFGATSGPRGHIDSFRTYDQDIARLRDFIRGRHPRLPLFLYGESMGGVISLNFAARTPEGLSGMILSSPVFMSRLKFPITSYIACFASLPVNPAQTIHLPFSSAMCTRDPSAIRTMDSDPLELRTASAKLLVGILMEQMRCRKSARRISLPTLFLTAGLDQFGDNRTTHRVYEKIAGQDKTYLFYPDMLHVLHVEAERNQVFQDVEDWLKKRI